jgi:thiamine pyrophosphokinase
MAIGKGSDFKLYDEYVHTRINELLAQNGQAFNEASAGAIRMTTRSITGNYEYASFFSSIGAGLASRRDVTSTSSQTDTAMTQAERVSVKCNRKLIPIAQTRDAFRKIFGAYDQTEFSGLMAEQYANAMQLEMLNTSLAAVAAALKQVAGNASYVVEASLGAISTNTLFTGLAAMGDRADRIVCWVMHSKPYYDLVKSQAAANITGVSNFNVATATPITCNRPVVITDSASLISNPTSPDVNNYYTLGLTADAVLVENSEEQEIVLQDVTGLENLVIRIQGEYAYNLSIKGFTWDVGNGGANPTSVALATGSNWDTATISHKDRAGVAINTL